ncbi:hypothetical protein QWW90_11240 [Neisseria gonorrhoeae]
MKKQDKNRLSKKDRRLIKKAMLKAAAKGSDEVYKIAPGLKDGFELLGKQLNQIFVIGIWLRFFGFLTKCSDEYRQFSGLSFGRTAA